MAHLTSALILAAVTASVLISFTDCGIIDLNSRFADTRFFRKLSTAEKRAVISLAIAFHDAPESANDPGVFPTNPIKPKAEEIPPTLYTAMMNGEVPKKWMKNFIRWLRTGLKISDASFNLYRHNPDYDVLCTADNKTCYSISDVGQQCCPFG